MPKVEIRFSNPTVESKDMFLKTYENFTKRHRLYLFKNKTLGVALIDLKSYKNYSVYYEKVNGKNSPAYYSRKALKRKYIFTEIDRNNYSEDIFLINTSSTIRQGVKMAKEYQEKCEIYKSDPHYRYFGVINQEKKLVAYCNIGFYGEFILISQLLGHKDFLNDGIMYLMILELLKLVFEEYANKGYKFVMYDTFWGAKEGLRLFKKKLRFKPFRVKWLWGIET